LHLLLIRCIPSATHCDGREVVMGEIALRVKLDGLRVPLLRLIQMPLPEFQETFGLVRGEVVGILLEYVIQKRFSVRRPAVIGEKIRPHGIGLRTAEWLSFERG